VLDNLGGENDRSKISSSLSGLDLGKDEVAVLFMKNSSSILGRKRIQQA
jgi:hypothetical protein